MLYSDNFLNELRNTVKEMLLNGDIPQISQVKELLEYSNIEFGDFIEPLFIGNYSSEKSEEGLVAYDIESVPNNIVVSKSDGSILHLPINKTTLVEARSVHGHYAEDGTYTEVPIETHPPGGV